MEIRKERRGKKGFILTLDVTLGSTLALIAIAVSLFLVTRGSATTLGEHQLARIGSDMLMILDEQKVFDTFDHEYIETKIEQVLPIQADMLIRVEGNFTEGNGTIEVGGTLPYNRPIISSVRVAMTDDYEYMKLTAFVWGRRE